MHASLSPDWQRLAVFLPHLQIVHHIQGRLRLRLLPSILTVLSSVSEQEFQRYLTAMPGILELRLNKPAASLIIIYNAMQIQFSWWERLILASNADLPALLAEIGVHASLCPQETRP